MNAPSKPNGRRATNISLDSEILADAKAFGINVSRACEEGLRAEVTKARNARWVEENREAMEASNAWVEKNGLPLARYRMF
jgi:antitoxin CcdA